MKVIWKTLDQPQSSRSTIKDVLDMTVPSYICKALPDMSFLIFQKKKNG